MSNEKLDQLIDGLQSADSSMISIPDLADQLGS
jgi:hypothetical protein